MNDAQNKADAAAPRARFSPLKMVARALGARAAAIPAAEIPAAAAPIARSVEAPEPAAEGFLALVNAMLADNDDGPVLAPEDGDIDLVALMAEAHAVFGHAARTRGVALALAVSPAAEGAWRGDALRLRQMLLNLVAGALAVAGDDVVALTADAVDATLTLRLDGPEAAAALHRAERSTARRAPPLAMACQVALALGGAVSVTAGEGARITIPLQRVTGVVPVPRIEAAPAFEPVAAFEPGLRVLVAEANPAHQQVLRALFAGQGVEAVVVGDGQDVVAAWRQERWDALLIDIEGEAIGGRNLVRAVRAAEEVLGWPRTPILALAAQARALDEAFAAQTDGLVAKPLQAAALSHALATALSAERDAAAAAAAA